MKLNTKYVVTASFDGDRTITMRYVNFDIHTDDKKFSLVDELHEASQFRDEKMAEDFMKYSNIEHELHADICICPIVPRVGMRATYGIGSDRYPYEVVEVGGKIEKGVPYRVTVRRMKIILGEGFDFYSNQVYNYESNVDASPEILTLRSDGYYRKHCKCGYWSFGDADYYQDPSF